MSDVKIYRPAKTATQSGRARSNRWVLEFSTALAQRRDSLMGWAGQGDTRRQVRLEFDSEAEAVAFARRNGLTYAVEPARQRRIRAKSYADNFRYGREGNWTH
ncbi:MAG: ETC complex I subunit [Defluviicoccus sp.]|nr:ETC complex I subunit [Defluviicoccus sp.]MDE0276829.1 ETC complex I subunit [Defluviicoccus sp.]